ncbi:MULTISPECIES: PRC-barrel domain-containing protein [Hyphobacterium]|uniref:PRC-barrel domain-containing protein n=1 Tax=Hyphobacterium vulgare TaxID=1736751 RepID=A0ABV6ZT51_9PROT
MKRFLIATTMLAFSAGPAFAADPQVTPEDNQTPPVTSDMPETTDPILDEPIHDDDTTYDEMDSDESWNESESDESWDEAELQNGFTDDHDWIDTAVFGSAGTELGNVERVRLSDAGEVEAIVVETGGVADVGGREVLIENGEFELVSNLEDDNTINLMIDAEGFAALPDFDEDLASDYPLSDDDAFDGVDEEANDDADPLEDDEIADPSL